MNLETLGCLICNFWTYQLKDITFYIFCHFLKFTKYELLTSCLCHQRGRRHVEDEFVAYDRNWSRELCLRARGRGEEPGGSGGWTKWSPAARRRPCPRWRDGGARWQSGPEGEEEEGGVPEDGGLTTSKKRSTARRGVAGVDRNRSRRAAAAVDWARTEATAPVVPRRLPARGSGGARGGARGGIILAPGGRRRRRA